MSANTVTEEALANLTLAIQELQQKSALYEDAVNTAYLGLTAFLIFCKSFRIEWY
jgi:hypothetical protein